MNCLEIAGDFAKRFFRGIDPTGERLDHALKCGYGLGRFRSCVAALSGKFIRGFPVSSNAPARDSILAVQRLRSSMSSLSSSVMFRPHTRVGCLESRRCIYA
jgi:hypothetical protein